MLIVFVNQGVDQVLIEGTDQGYGSTLNSGCLLLHMI